MAPKEHSSGMQGDEQRCLALGPESLDAESSLMSGSMRSNYDTMGTAEGVSAEPRRQRLSGVS